jgi:RNA polymerase sigma factor (sigma-70 family)
MNAATPEDEIDDESETGAPTPALVLMRTRKEPRAAGSPSRADDASRGDLPRPGPVEPVDQAMTAMDVRMALAQLTPEHRQVIVEMFYLGRSVTEIAQLLSIPEGTVKSRSYYSMRQLKRYGRYRERGLFGRTQGDGP